MYMQDILIAHGLVTSEDVTVALEVQRAKGGTLSECLVQVGKLKATDLDTVIRSTPKSPRTLADTGLSVSNLLNLMIKAILSHGELTPSGIAETLKLPHRTVQELIFEGEERRLLDLRAPAVRDGGAELRYGLTEKGGSWAHDAMQQNQYVGPAPVTLAAFRDQVNRQKIGNERVTREMIDEVFGDLVAPESMVSAIGPAINSGRSILLYGPPGNGKTSIGERIGRIFNDIIYLPYCFEVDGQVVKVFDSALHTPIHSRSGAADDSASLRREDVDLRWVACRRPFVVAGGELTLEMLDLSFNDLAKYYEAPLHIKALGGIFLIDDFGRQLVSPSALLNRWIVPMESRVEYLKLHTGKSFSIPFDELVIFSTNLSPRKLMDAAFLRRIPYKILVSGPSAEAFHQIFRTVAAKAGVEVDARVIDAIIIELRDRNNFPLASYQPKFIVEQVLAAAKFDGVRPAVTLELIAQAIRNLMTREGSDLDGSGD
jgi:predicted ATPase with chaperone activity